MIHLVPHWNWQGKEGNVIPVMAYTNCDTVELFLNGKSYGAKAVQFPRPGTVAPGTVMMFRLLVLQLVICI